MHKYIHIYLCKRIHTYTPTYICMYKHTHTSHIYAYSFNVFFIIYYFITLYTLPNRIEKIYYKRLFLVLLQISYYITCAYFIDCCV